MKAMLKLFSAIDATNKLNTAKLLGDQKKIGEARQELKIAEKQWSSLHKNK